MALGGNSYDSITTTYQRVRLINNSFAERYQLQFSDDSSSFAYFGKRDGKMFFVRNNTETELKYDNVTLGPLLTPKNTIAYVAKSGKQHILVLDGKEIYKTDNVIKKVIFSDNGENYALAEYPDISVGSISNFTPGKVVRDGSVASFDLPHGFMSTLRFGLNKELIYISGKYKEMFVAYGDKQYGGKYYRINELIVSEDLKNVAYIAESEDRSNTVMLNGEEVASYKDGKIVTDFSFTDDNRLAYILTDANIVYGGQGCETGCYKGSNLIVDGRSLSTGLPNTEKVSDFTLGNTGKYIVFSYGKIAVNGTLLDASEVDKVNDVVEYTNILYNPSFNFDSSHYLFQASMTRQEGSLKAEKSGSDEDASNIVFKHFDTLFIDGEYDSSRDRKI